MGHEALPGHTCNLPSFPHAALPAPPRPTAVSHASSPSPGPKTACTPCGPGPVPHSRSHRRHLSPHRRPPPQDNTTPAVASKYRRCWDQLCRPNIRKADVAVAWRALHCQLRTPSFLTYCRYKSGPVQRSGDTPMQQACCRWPACRAPLATNPAILQPTTIANTTHILLHCPLTHPAAQWLCDLWAAIDDGNAPPARVLWHMHSLGVLLFISLLLLEPAPIVYTYVVLHYAVGCFMSLF